MERDDDETLYRRYLDGDEGALRMLLERHREGLTLFIYGIVGNMDDAEELMIDAFAALAARDHVFRGGSTLKTWLFSIGRNKAVSWTRRKHPRFVRLVQEDGTLDADGPGTDVAEEISDALEAQRATVSPDFKVLSDERNACLFHALLGLNPDYREALMLAYFEDMDCKDAAKVMGKTGRQYSDLLYRGKLSLRAILEREGFEYA